MENIDVGVTGGGTSDAFKPALLNAPFKLLFLQGPQRSCGHIYRRDEELDPRRTLCSPFDPCQVLVKLGKRRPQPPLSAQKLCTVDEQENAGWPKAKRPGDRVGEFLRP